MSLWRVKHTLSPFVEAALVAVAASYGFLAIYLASLKPFADAAIAPVVSLPQPVSLNIDDWTRHDDPAGRFAFAAPPGWIVDLADPAAIRLGRSKKEIAFVPASGAGLSIGLEALQPRQEIANLAAADFIGSRPALYDVSVDGRRSLFALAFENGHIRRQAVYVPESATAVVVLRAATADPAVFSALVSTLKFYHPES